MVDAKCSICRFQYPQVVDFDLERSSATQLIPTSVKSQCESLGFEYYWCLRVCGRVVLACALGVILLFDCESKRLAIVPTEVCTNNNFHTFTHSFHPGQRATI